MTEAHESAPPPGKRPIRAWLILTARLLLVLVTAALVWLLLHLM